MGQKLSMVKKWVGANSNQQSDSSSAHTDSTQLSTTDTEYKNYEDFKKALNSSVFHSTPKENDRTRRRRRKLVNSDYLDLSCIYFH